MFYLQHPVERKAILLVLTFLLAFPFGVALAAYMKPWRVALAQKHILSMGMLSSTALYALYELRDRMDAFHLFCCAALMGVFAIGVGVYFNLLFRGLLW